MNLLITDKARTNLEDFNMIVSWNDQEINTQIKLLKLSDFIDGNSINIQEIFLDSLNVTKNILVKNLNDYECSDRFKMQDFNLIFEKSFWKTPNYYELIKLHSLRLLFKVYKVKRLTVDLNSKKTSLEINNIFRYSLSKKNIEKISYRAENLFSFFIKVIKHFIYANIFYLKFIFTNRHFIFSNEKTFDSNSFANVFFGDTTDFHFQENKISLNILNDLEKNYLKDNSLSLIFYKQISKYKNYDEFDDLLIRNSRDGNQFLFLESFLSPKVIFFSWWVFHRRLIYLIFSGEIFRLRNIIIQCPNLSFLTTDFMSSFIGKHCMDKFIYIEILSKIVSLLKRDALANPISTKLFFTQENQYWEKALISIWKKEVNNLTHGVVKSSFSFWDLRHSFNQDLFASFKSYFPENILFTNPFSKSNYSDFYKPSSLLNLKFVQAEIPKRILNQQISKPLKFLFFGDYTVKNNDLIIRMLDPIISDDTEIIFKPHPGRTLIKDIPKVQYSNKLIILESIDLYQYIKNGYILIFSSSTGASLNAAFITDNLIIFRLPNQPNLSPIFNFTKSFFISNQTQLRNRIDYLAHNNDKNRSKIPNNYYY